jgi:hypothetical protein
VHRTADHKRQAMRRFEEALLVAEESMMKSTSKAVN